MVEYPSKKSPHPLLSGHHIIYGLLAVLIGCGGIYLFLYVYLNSENVRAGLVASEAQERVEQIYAKTREVVPVGVTLIGEEKPQSSTYAWGLSDGAPRYARVHAQQIYTATTALSDVVATYKANFVTWGWVTLPVSNESDLLSIVFRHPSDENLLVGLCSPVEGFSPIGSTQYIIFFDFDETAGCEGRTRLGCVAARYCKYR